MKIENMLLILICILFFSGCSLNNSKPNQNSIGIDMCNTIMECFINEDVDKLKNVFCTKVINSHNIDDEIQKAFDFVDGKIISECRFLVSGGELVDEGILLDSHIYPTIINIQTDSEKNYRIIFHCNIVYENNQDLVGVLYLKVIDDATGKKVQIGEYLHN